MQFGILFIDQRMRRLSEGSLDTVRLDPRYIVLGLPVTLIPSYDEWHANCTAVSPMSTSVLYRVLNPCQLNGFVSRFPQSINNDTGVPAWAFANVSVRPMTHSIHSSQSHSWSIGNVAMGQRHCLCGRRQPRVSWYFPPAIRTEVRYRRCCPCRRDCRRGSSMHGRGPCDSRGGRVVLSAPLSTATSGEPPG